MSPDQEAKLARQSAIGKDNGMRLRLQWESGYSVAVHSWEAAAAITGRVSASTLRQYWYKQNLHKEHLANGLLCPNPDNYGRVEPCFFTMDIPPRRGPPIDPERQKLKERELQLKIDARALRLRKAELQLEQLKNRAP